MRAAPNCMVQHHQQIAFRGLNSHGSFGHEVRGAVALAGGEGFAAERPVDAGEVDAGDAPERQERERTAGQVVTGEDEFARHGPCLSGAVHQADIRRAAAVLQKRGERGVDVVQPPA